jgi:7-cyano-7-deazaguanine synthase
METSIEISKEKEKYQPGSRIQFEGDRDAVVLVSGGADSIPVLYYVAKILQPSNITAVHVDYGQTMMEMERYGVSKNVDYLISQGYLISLKYIELKWLGELSTSRLVSKDPLPETPSDKLQDPESASERILWWWDVCRNAVLTIVGIAHAESFDLKHYLSTHTRRISDVYLGIRRETPVAMKDNTPEFIEEMNRVAQISTHFGGYQVKAPFIDLDKSAVIRMGEALGVKWIYTFSCYTNPNVWVTNKEGDRVLAHCGRCSNDKRRALAFSNAGVTDPSFYLSPPTDDYIPRKGAAATLYVSRKVV